MPKKLNKKTHSFNEPDSGRQTLSANTSNHLFPADERILRQYKITAPFEAPIKSINCIKINTYLSFLHVLILK